MTTSVCKSTEWNRASSPYGAVKDQLTALDLHAIPWMRDYAGRRSYNHAQSLKVVDPAPPPTSGPGARKLRCSLPELFVITAMLSFGKSNLFDTIFPVLIGLIL